MTRPRPPVELELPPVAQPRGWAETWPRHRSKSRLRRRAAGRLIRGGTR